MTKFCGHKTGFNPRGENECVPNVNGPPATKFGGRPAVPAGPLKRYPSGASEISGGNRRLAKTGVGDGSGDGVAYTGAPNAFKSK